MSDADLDLINFLGKIGRGEEEQLDEITIPASSVLLIEARKRGLVRISLNFQGDAGDAGRAGLTKKGREMLAEGLGK